VFLFRGVGNARARPEGRVAIVVVVPVVVTTTEIIFVGRMC
jgi:hypothetical protein